MMNHGAGGRALMLDGPGSAAPGSMPMDLQFREHGWDGREPVCLVVGKALAPWPLWLPLCAALGTGPDSMGAWPLAFATVCLMTGLMVRRAVNRGSLGEVFLAWFVTGMLW